ncbi:very-long-chain (3R)-3-hydroxyacyl-CoA dehydratase 3 [Trichechus manatus latirostris]|uniref:Very-long-chain (3R)-3-hydroxyacyl-CoA dehydratase n=1 Tax=Trichechus manatus latirostris TaxID=127582 RepID=A0A2Y9QU64_TRIMA|nr:very-long-chain (3R)-3-hydroxyacyl-CoA dehydratase 3 [Trichechus manatus latirostris]
MENQVLTPHVYWAQRHRELYLRVELSDVQNPAISITENVLHFKAQGHGAKGDNVYEFHLEFLDPVKPEPVYKLTQRQVNITVQKKVSQWWERPTKQEKRPLFLAPDFDRWLDESDAEMELRTKVSKNPRILPLKTEIMRSPTLASMKKGYLFMYNLVQFLGFSWIFVNLTVRFFLLGKESFYDTFHTVADMMYFCQMLAAVETINAAVGVTNSPVLPSLLQKQFRGFCFRKYGRLGGLMNSHAKNTGAKGQEHSFEEEPKLEDLPYKKSRHYKDSGCIQNLKWLVISELLIFNRYPFYMLTCIDMDWKVLTWLRYSVWIPMYPLGCLAEAVAVIQSIPVFNETGRFSFTLPYPVKVKVRFSFFLQIYLVVLFLGLYINFRHLYKQRRRRYGQRKKKIH